MDSILTSIKKMLGIEKDATEFDQELIMFINSVLGICFQLGVGPKDEPFTISGKDEVWADFIQDDQIESVKTYILLQHRLFFLPTRNWPKNLNGDATLIPKRINVRKGK